VKHPCAIPLIALIATLLAGHHVAAVENETEAACLKSAAFLVPLEEAGGRHYAPEYDVRARHLTIDVTPDFKLRTVTGTTTIKFQALRRPVKELRLDALHLKVSEVTSTARLQTWHADDDSILIVFAEPIAPEQEASVTVAYSAEPKAGLYFRTPEQGYLPGDTHLFSQGEEVEARHWFPCLDAPNVKLTSEVTCHVPSGMTVVSNGRLVDQTKDSKTGLVAFHWSQEKPHANYLITLVAGYFAKLEAKHGSLPLAFYTPPSEAAEAPPSFRSTEDTMAFFEREIGVPYPWAKYDQICVNDFVAGGMENTSATTLTDSTLFSDATENLHDSESLVAHEMAHQWFGDLVTCKDWCHVWLNEGFATYYEALYHGYHKGHDAMLLEFLDSARQITGMPDDINPIVRRNYGAPRDLFNYLAYPKGSWVLRMLRADLGDDLFRRCIKTYLERFQYGSVGTEDLRGVIEQLSGRSFDRFFDQWVYHAHHPELDATYAWDAGAKLAKLTIRQTQKVSDQIMLFDVPLRIRFQGKFGVVEKTARLTKTDETFSYAMESAPENVRLDPECELLAKISFTPPQAMVAAQLKDPHDVIGRLMAIRQLARRQESGAFAGLKRALEEDPCPPVRAEAATGLRSLHTPEALAELISQTRQPDARVRLQVIAGLGGFYSEAAYAASKQAMEREHNPAILATAIRNLGAYPKGEVHDILLKELGVESFHHRVAEGAIAAMRTQADPTFVAPLLRHLRDHEAAFTPDGLGQVLGTLAWLARDQENKEEVRQFLLDHLDSKRRAVQNGAINALGTLADPKAVPALEAISGTPRENEAAQGAAEAAINQIRSGRKPATDDLRALRQQVLDLEKANRELRKEVDEIKHHQETPPAKPAAAPAATAPHPAVVTTPPKKP